MKILIDMNLSPKWVGLLQSHGMEAVHWSSIGKPNAHDSEIMQWARQNEHVIFTHDLDFGTLLALTHEQGPSVLQIRTQDITLEAIGYIIIKLFQDYEKHLLSGSLIVADMNKARVRILPL